MNATLHPDRMRFRYQRINPDLPAGIHLPKHEGDCGWDLSIMYDAFIPTRIAQDLEINCRLELPPGYWAEMRPRSSIAKRGLQVDAGIIDNGYRGPLFVVVRNTGLTAQRLDGGERVAQLIFHRLHEVWAEEVGPQHSFSDSSRGEAGFGSTGIT